MVFVFVFIALDKAFINIDLVMSGVDSLHITCICHTNLILQTKYLIYVASKINILTIRIMMGETDVLMLVYL